MFGYRPELERRRPLLFSWWDHIQEPDENTEDLAASLERRYIDCIFTSCSLSVASKHQFASVPISRHPSHFRRYSDLLASSKMKRRLAAPRPSMVWFALQRVAFCVCLTPQRYSARREFLYRPEEPAAAQPLCRMAVSSCSHLAYVLLSASSPSSYVHWLQGLGKLPRALARRLGENSCDGIWDVLVCLFKASF